MWIAKNGCLKKGWENAHHAYLPVSYDLNQWPCLNQPEQFAEQSLISNMIMKSNCSLSREKVTFANFIYQKILNHEFNEITTLCM